MEKTTNWDISVLAQLGCFLALWLMSYFGAPNPYSLGLLSGFGVVCLGLGLTLLARRFGRVAFGIFLSLVVFVYLFLVVTNWWYFDYFQSLYNYESLRLGEDIFEGTRAIPAVGYRSEALVLLLLTAGLSGLSIATYKQPVEGRRGHIAWAAPLAIAFLVTLLLVDPAVNRYRNQNIAWMLPSHMHPVQAFFYSQETMKSLQPDEIEAAERFQQANRQYTIPVAPGQSPTSLPDDRQYNVILIMLESMRADLIGHWGGGQSVTPNLDRLARRYISARNFYANTNFTVSGELAALCGIFDHNTRPPISKYFNKIKALDCLPSRLHAAGYETHYLHGHYSRFYDRDRFIPLLGFTETYFHGDSDWDQSKRMGWGISDLVMVDIVMDRLQRDTKRPFFAHFMTLSSHYPFNNEWGIEVPYETSFDVQDQRALSQNYLNAARFADHMIGEFWRQFQQSDLFDETIVIITSDHGIWAFDPDTPESVLLRNEKFFRAPLIIYHPDIQGPIEIQQVTSQIDIPPTIAAMLGDPDLQSHFMGKNMLVEVEDPWSISFKTSQLMVKNGDRTCYIDSNECGGVHQSCSTQFDTSLFWKSLDEKVTCVVTERDLLLGGEASEVESQPEVIDTAQKLISFHNKSAVEY